MGRYARNLAATTPSAMLAATNKATLEATIDVKPCRPVTFSTAALTADAVKSSASGAGCRACLAVPPLLLLLPLLPPVLPGSVLPRFSVGAAVRSCAARLGAAKEEDACFPDRCLCSISMQQCARSCCVNSGLSVGLPSKASRNDCGKEPVAAVASACSTASSSVSNTKLSRPGGREWSQRVRRKWPPAVCRLNALRPPQMRSETQPSVSTSGA
mmetsp:Transcript_44478/g.88141  ORF Transcript_44478/g.88141 Transcript_44478/m.88141 type:complete len:214 (+) Transcript_44478:1422-2063(+)